MIPRISKTLDRQPYPIDGKTILVYWQILDANTAVIPLDPSGNPAYRGIAQILSEDDAANMRDLGGMRSAMAGEEVIALVDVNGNKTGQYEQIHHIDPMDNEPQRWFAFGVDPNKPETLTNEYRNSPPVIFDAKQG